MSDRNSPKSGLHEPNLLINNIIIIIWFSSRIGMPIIG